MRDAARRNNEWSFPFPAVLPAIRRTMRTDPSGPVATTRPPAKLNLFLELLARREDGFHEIDTVMVPVDWCDTLSLRRTNSPGIQIHADWIPSTPIIARRLGIDGGDSLANLMAIPEDERNLVHRALTRFIDCFDIQGGFDCVLGKSIPAGAGMGGASSDAASALRCAAALCRIPLAAPELTSIAADIGSDVPFFLGHPNGESTRAARATGRGEILDRIDLTSTLDCVIAFPGVNLSTAEVYADCRISQAPQSSSQLVAALEGGQTSGLGSMMVNRLEEPAKKKAPRIDEILESLWQTGLEPCQLTGSGSACFAIASSTSDSRRSAMRVRATQEPGAIVRSVRTTTVPARVDLG